METTTFDDFYTYLSQCPSGSGITNYDLGLVLPFNYDFNNECSGPSMPAINTPHLCHTRVSGSSHHQEQFAPINPHQFYAHQGQEGAMSSNFPTERFTPSWYPEPPTAGSLNFSPPEPVCSTDTVLLYRGQALSIPNLPAGSGVQASFYEQEKGFQFLDTAPFSHPEEGPSNAKSMAFYRTQAGKAQKVQSKVTRFTPIKRPKFQPQQDQRDAAWSFDFPTNNFTAPHLSESSSIHNTETGALFVGVQASMIPDLQYPPTQITKQSTPALDDAGIASRPNASTLKIAHSKRKTSKNHGQNSTHPKVQSIKGLVITVEKENVKCIVGECQVLCASINEYKVHLKTVHGIRNSHTPGDKIDCPVSGCARKLREGSLMRHILTHMDAVRVLCAVCYASYSRVETLRAHIHSHGGSVT